MVIMTHIFLMKNKLFCTFQILLMTGFLGIILHSCDSGKSHLPRSSGSINELLIITDSRTSWKGDFGDSLREFFARSQVGMPQPEPVFDIINIPAHDLGAFYQKFHNIFIAEIDPKITKARFEVKKNVWSNPQRVIKIVAADEKSFISEFDQRKDTITKVFDQLERQRTFLLEGESYANKAAEAVRKKFSINLLVPGGFYVARQTPDFIWLRRKFSKPTPDTELGILIYSSDNPDTIAFKPKHIISLRNKITWQNMITPPGSSMKVSGEYIPPIFTVIPDFTSGYAIETRGIWEVQNDFMGGSFISSTFVHPRTKKVITLDGYVYNPNNDKNDFIRRLESIFWTVQL
jgi:hypothetical protein